MDLSKRVRCLLCVLAFAATASPQAVKHELQQKLATVKESVARNQAALRQYSWTEHTDISLKGETKASSNNLCRYGRDDQVAKTPAGTEKRVDRKSGELQDYVERATALLGRYLPPSPNSMEAAFQAGNASLGPAGAGKIQLKFKDYAKPGDWLLFNFQTATKTLESIGVNTWLDDPKDDPATLAVDFLVLPDGTNYIACTTLTAASKQLQVKITNSNYRKIVP